VGCLFDLPDPFFTLLLPAAVGGGGLDDDEDASIWASGVGLGFFADVSFVLSSALDFFLAAFFGLAPDDDAAFPPRLCTSSSALLSLFAADSSFSVGTMVSGLGRGGRGFAMDFGFVIGSGFTRAGLTPALPVILTLFGSPSGPASAGFFVLEAVTPIAGGGGDPGPGPFGGGPPGAGPIID